MKTFKDFLDEGSVVQFSRTAAPTYSKKINKTTAPDEEGKLNKGQIVYRSTHDSRSPSPKNHYGEVVHHNKKEATVHWDDGTVMMHNREHGAPPAKEFNAETQPRQHWYAQAINSKNGGTPGVKTREEHKRAHAEFTAERYHHYYGRHEPARNKAFEDVKTSLNKSGLNHTSKDNEHEYNNPRTYEVNTPDHNEVKSALVNNGWSHKQSDNGLTHHYTKETDHGISTAWHHDNALVNPVQDKWHADNNIKPLNTKHLDSMMGSLGFKKPDASKTPGWRHAKVKVWVNAEANKKS